MKGAICPLLPTHYGHPIQKNKGFSVQSFRINPQILRLYLRPYFLELAGAIPIVRLSMVCLSSRVVVSPVKPKAQGECLMIRYGHHWQSG